MCARVVCVRLISAAVPLIHQITNDQFDGIFAAVVTYMKVACLLGCMGEFRVLGVTMCVCLACCVPPHPHSHRIVLATTEPACRGRGCEGCSRHDGCERTLMDALTGWLVLCFGLAVACFCVTAGYQLTRSVHPARPHVPTCACLQGRHAPTIFTGVLFLMQAAVRHHTLVSVVQRDLTKMNLSKHAVQSIVGALRSRCVAGLRRCPIAFRLFTFLCCCCCCGGGGGGGGRGRLWRRWQPVCT